MDPAAGGQLGFGAQGKKVSSWLQLIQLQESTKKLHVHSLQAVLVRVLVPCQCVQHEARTCAPEATLLPHWACMQRSLALTQQEVAGLQHTQHFLDRETGYQWIQKTKPQASPTSPPGVLMPGSATLHPSGAEHVKPAIAVNGTLQLSACHALSG